MQLFISDQEFAIKYWSYLASFQRYCRSAGTATHPYSTQDLRMLPLGISSACNYFIFEVRVTQSITTMVMMVFNVADGQTILPCYKLKLTIISSTIKQQIFMLKLLEFVKTLYGALCG